MPLGRRMLVSLNYDFGLGFSGHGGRRQKPQLQPESLRREKPSPKHTRSSSPPTTSLPPDETDNSSNTRPLPKSRPVTPPASQQKVSSTAKQYSLTQQRQDPTPPNTEKSRQLLETPPEARVCVLGSEYSLQSLAPQPSTSVSQKSPAEHREPGPRSPHLCKPPVEDSGWEPGHDTHYSTREDAGTSSAGVGQRNHQGVGIEPGFNGRGQDQEGNTPWPGKARGGSDKEDQRRHVSEKDWEHPTHEGNLGGGGQGRGERREPLLPVSMNIDVVGRIRPQSRGEGLSSLHVEASGRVAAQAGGPYFG